jgi:hypothetical protein
MESLCGFIGTGELENKDIEGFLLAFHSSDSEELKTFGYPHIYL